MAYPHFWHIHCSSRYDRSAASLEADIDNWIQHCSLITLTEITVDQRAAQMNEKGWGYFNSKKDDGSDQCGTMWAKDTWIEKRHVTRQLNKGGFISVRTHHRQPPTFSETVLLKRRHSDHLLLVSTSHLPAGVEGGWFGHKNSHDAWAVRKQAYQVAMKAWSAHVNDLARKWHPDAVLAIADWNLNLKLTWVQDYLHSTWPDYRQAWRNFPTSGGALQGGPHVPAGAPGKGHGDKIIDGTLYRGLSVAFHPEQMAAVRSSDHRPYVEAFEFTAKAGKGIVVPHTPEQKATGDTKPGPAWWGFGDYIDDELYMVDNGGVPYYPDLYVGTGGEGGEVL